MDDLDKFLNTTLGNQSTPVVAAPSKLDFFLDKALTKPVMSDPLSIGAGTVANIGQGFTGNFLSKLSGAVSAIPGYLGAVSAGNPEHLSIGDVYEAEKNKAKAGLEQFRTEHPAIAISSQIGGAVLSPINKLKLLSGAGKLASLAASGAGQGAIYGAGSADGDISDYAKEIAIGAGLGSVLNPIAAKTGDALGWVGKKAGELGESTKNAMYGITKKDLIQSLKHDVRLPGEQAKIVKSLDDLVKEGSLTPGDAAENLANTELKINELHDQIGDIFSKVDEVQPKEMIPEYSYTQKYIKSLDPTEQKTAQRMFNEMKADQLKDNILVSEWERTKSALQRAGRVAQGMAGTEKTMANLKKTMGFDIKTSIDKELANPIYAQKLGMDTVKTVQGFRKALSDRHTIMPALMKAAGTEGTQVATNMAKGLWKTTGGYGVPLGIGAVTGASEYGKSGDINKSLTKFAEGMGGAMLLESPAGQKAISTTLKSIFSPSASVLGEVIRKGATPSALSVLTSEVQRANDKKAAQSKSNAFKPRSLQTTATHTDLNSILNAIKHVESRGNTNAVSKTGAKGAYQFMDKTAAAYGLTDPFDEKASREAAGRLISDEFSALGSLPLALAAYNAGRPAVLKAVKKAGSAKWADIAPYLPEETQKYVPLVYAQLT